MQKRRGECREEERSYLGDEVPSMIMSGHLLPGVVPVKPLVENYGSLTSALLLVDLGITYSAVRVGILTPF